MFSNYLTVALRNLLRRKAFSSINIVGLSIALVCCMLILLYAKDETSFDRFHANEDRIYRLTLTFQKLNTGEQNYIGSTGLSAGDGFGREIPEIESLVRIQESSALVRKGNQVLNEHFLYADAGFFSVFSFPLEAGSPQAALSGLQSVVLTEETAVKYFGTADAVGRVLELSTDGAGFKRYQVTAIARRPPLNSSIQFTMLLPMALYRQANPARDEGDWFNAYLHTFVLLHPEADPGAVVAKFPSVLGKYAAGTFSKFANEFGIKVSYGLQPLPELHLAQTFRAENGLAPGSDPVYAYMLLCIAGFILLIASFNFINLSVAQSLRRAREIGVRKAIGAVRGQLVKQFLGESFLLCLLAFALALLLAVVALPLFNRLAGKQLSFAYLLDIRLAAVYLGILLLTALVAGSYPAWVLSGFRPVQALSGGQPLTGRNLFAKALVVLQFSLATFLVMGTIVIYWQMQYVSRQDLGFNSENLVRIRLPRQGDQVLPRLKNELSQRADILKVAGSSEGVGYFQVQVAGKDLRAAYLKVDENYLQALGISLKAGRPFSAEFAADSSQSVLVNETFVREAGWQDPLGKTLVLMGDAGHLYTVVGVVKDYHFRPLREKIEPLVMHQFPGRPYGEAWVKIRSGNLPQTLAMLEKTYREAEPLYPCEYQFMDVLNARQYEAEGRWKGIVGLAAGLTIFISCIGLLGLATLAIGQRTKEIGIRKVMGASVPGIVALLSRDFLKLVAIAFLAAAPLGYYASSRWLSTFAYRTPLHWWLFALAGLLALLVALLTLSIQSVKAALNTPLKALRSE